MSTYQLEQTGQQVQNILNEAPQTKLDLQSEIERATGKEGELAQAIADEKTRAEGIEGGLRTDLDAEIQRATDKDVVLENAIDAEETRAEGVEGALRDDVDAIDAVIPNQASSSNQLADKAFVNSSIATNTADFKGTYNSLEQLETEVTDANANDYAFVIGTDQTGNTVYNRYKYVEGTGWEFEYALNNSSFTASQWAAINSAITAALVAKLTGLPTAEALTTSLNDLLTAIGAEKTRAELIEAGLRTDVNANAGAIVTEKNRAEGVEGTLTNGLTGEIQNRSNADTALGLRIDGEATLRENADSALQGDIDAIDAKIPTQASSSNQLADKAFVNSSIATNTAEFKGTYNSLEALEESVTDANANDYAFVISTDEAGNTVYNRYKYVEGTGWVFEYALNNSSFTSAQWAAINSGITAALVAKLSALPTNDALTAALSAITDVIPTAASSSNKLIDAAQFVAALATKQNTLTFDSTPTANSNNPVTSQGIKNAIDALDAAKADKATTLAGYGIEDAYTKTEVNGLVSTPHENYVTVPTYASLPATGSADTIYRVSSYDGANSQVDNTVYSEYAWNGSAYVFLCVKSQIDEVFDITVYNSNTKYADLAAALGTDGANIPQSLRRGGMSVKFVQSSDNNYIRYNLLADSFTTDVTKWAIDDAGVYVKAPEFIEVKTDSEEKILWAIKADGSIYWGAGVPQQVIDYVASKIQDYSLDEIVTFLGNLIEGDTLATLLNGKVDKVTGKSLIDSNYASSKEVINNPEWIELKTDNEGKILEGINTNKKEFYIPTKFNTSINIDPLIFQEASPSQATTYSMFLGSAVNPAIWNGDVAGAVMCLFTLPENTRHIKITQSNETGILFLLQDAKPPINGDLAELACNSTGRILLTPNKSVLFNITEDCKAIAVQYIGSNNKNVFPTYIGFSEKLDIISDEEYNNKNDNFFIGGEITDVEFNDDPITILSNKDESATEKDNFIIAQGCPLKVNDNLYFFYYACQGDSEVVSDANMHLALAYSTDGFNWVRGIPEGITPPIPGTNIIMNKDAIGATVVKVPDTNYPFRMLAFKYYDSTNLYKSADGVNWTLIKSYPYYYDNNPSIIVRGEYMKIYFRRRDGSGRQDRYIGVVTCDFDGNVLTPPTIFFGKWLYNAGASPLDDRREIMFPTYFNTTGGKCHLQCYVVDGNRIYPRNVDFSRIQMPSGQWTMVCPNIINIGSEFYIFYSTDSKLHDESFTSDTETCIKMAKVTFINTGYCWYPR